MEIRVGLEPTNGTPEATLRIPTEGSKNLDPQRPYPVGDLQTNPQRDFYNFARKDSSTPTASPHFTGILFLNSNSQLGLEWIADGYTSIISGSPFSIKKRIGLEGDRVVSLLKLWSARLNPNRCLVYEPIN